MFNRKLLVVLSSICLMLGACAETDQPDPAPGAKSSPTKQESSEKQSKLTRPCEQAFALIDKYDPGEAPRKEAVEIANTAFVADDSPEVSEAFSNLNNVYVFDDGTSSPSEVRSQLEKICPPG